MRSALDFRSFVRDSLPVEHLGRMLAYPFVGAGGAESVYRGPMLLEEGGQFTETACYVALSAFALAALAPRSGVPRVAWFWIAIAVAGLLLSLGDATPLASFTFGLPGFDLFRIPGRHAFEFTYAMAILAGLGVSALVRGARTGRVLIAALVGPVAIVAWATADIASAYAGFERAPAITIFFAAFAIQVALLVAATWTRLDPFARGSLGCAAVIAGALPFAATSYWLDAPSSAIVAKPPYVSALARLPLGTGQRIYTGGTGRITALDPNLPFTWNVPDVSGYTPLQFATVATFLQTNEGGRLLDVSSPMVDLAAVRYFAVPAEPDGTVDAATRYGRDALGSFLSIGRPNAPRRLRYGLAVPAAADEIALVSALGASVDVPQGREVASIVVHDASGASETIPLRAGVETAELAFDRPDVRDRIRHRRAHVYARNGPNDWYECVLPISLRAAITSVDVSMKDSSAALNIRSISFVDRRNDRAYPLTDESVYYADRRRFRHLTDVDGVALFENMSSFPAVWIARATLDSMAPSGDIAAAAYRERLRSIDLRRDALVSGEASTHVGGTAAVIRDDAERRIVETSCRATCLLVSSMTFTSDWNVDIDGRPGRLVRADGFLQGALVPAGDHRVTFRYRPAAARDGIVISGAAIASFVFWLAFRRRRMAPRPKRES